MYMGMSVRRATTHRLYYLEKNAWLSVQPQWTAGEIDAARDAGRGLPRGDLSRLSIRNIATQQSQCARSRMRKRCRERQPNVRSS